MISYGKQDITKQDLDAVSEVLQSDFLTQGPEVERFEKGLSDYAGANHAIAVNSATSALHIAYNALGVGPGDIVWTSPITFVATSNCALMLGAAVDFVDIDIDTFNMSVSALQAKLEQARADDALPKVVVPVHMGGQSCDMQAIWALSKEYGFHIVEDASHAVGGEYLGKKVGCCQFSDIAVFSFHPVKIITTGEGGAALTNDPDLARAMRMYSSHGITRDADNFVGEKQGGWDYQQIELGYNYRITDIQAALGTSQLTRLDAYVEQRHLLFAEYQARLSSMPLHLPTLVAECKSSLHLYIVRIDEEKTNKTRLAFFDFMRANNIGVKVHYIPVHTQPFYCSLGFAVGDFPIAEKYYSQALTLPLHPKLTQADMDFVVEKVSEFFSGE